MKTKIILWSLVSILFAGLATGIFLWLHKPQIILLNGGTKLTLVGVTYGQHHVAPKIKLAGGRVRSGGGRLDSTNDTLVVWIMAEHKPNQYPNYQLMVYDQANTACVSTYARTQSQIKEGVEMQGFTLEAFSRRERKILLHVMSWGNGGQRVSKESFVVANPVRGAFAKWTPDPLPDSQSDGDLDVTLTKLVAAAPSPYNRGNGTARNDPINKCVQFDFDVQQKGQSATNWRPVQVDTTDATGNHIKGWINDYRPNGQKAGYFYQSGLWPDEPAWKVRLEMSRTSGFSDDEFWSITNVPVKAGSQQEMWNNWNSDGNQSAFLEKTVNGIHLKLFPAIQFKDQNQGGGQTVSFTIKADPDPESAGMRLTLIKVADDQGRELQNRGSSWGGGRYQYQFSGGRNPSTLNLTIVLQKSRFVEFTVKPQTAAANP
jgi:hypothetical protein